MIKKIMTIFFVSAILWGGTVTTVDAAGFATLFLHIIVENSAAKDKGTDCIYYDVDMSSYEDDTSAMKASVHYISSGRNKTVRNLTAMLNTQMPKGQVVSVRVNQTFPDFNEQLFLSAMPQDLCMRLYDEGAIVDIDFKLPAGDHSRVPEDKNYQVTYTLTDNY